MKKIALVVFVAALLGVAGVAWADGYWYDYGINNYEAGGDPGFMSYYPTARYHGAHPPVDIRVKIAEAEKLKASLHYYSMSQHPYDRATADWMAAELDYVLSEIDAWYGIVR